MSQALVFNPNESRQMSESHPSDGLRRSPLGSLILLTYQATQARRRWRIGRKLINLILRLEGGPVWSATARDIMHQYHGVQIGAYSYGDCFDPALIPPGVSIGRYVSIAPGVRFHTQNHPIDRLSSHPFFYDARLGLVERDALEPAALEVGHDAWIGRNAMTTPGCRRIGIGAVVGAGAVVTRDVPDFAIVAGNPARLLRYRFSPETIEKIHASRWWLKPVAELAPHLPEMSRTLEGSDRVHPLLRS